MPNPPPAPVPQLLVVTGKGGVGKTTLCALLALDLAARGRRVLALEVDPRESLHAAFGAAPSDGAVVSVDDRLAFQNLQPRLVLDALVRERLRVGMLVNRTLQSPIYQHFVEGAPGLKEIAILGHALQTVRRGEADSVVLDAPASGHGLSLLRAPGLVSAVIPRGPVGTLARELAEFVGDPALCAVAIATRPEEMPVQEALELVSALAVDGRRPALVIANGMAPPFPRGERRDAIGNLWRERRTVHERQLEALRSAIGKVSLLVLPLVARSLGPEMLEELRAAMLDDWAVEGEPWR